METAGKLRAGDNHGESEREKVLQDLIRVPQGENSIFWEHLLFLFGQNVLIKDIFGVLRL